MFAVHPDQSRGTEAELPWTSSPAPTRATTHHPDERQQHVLGFTSRQWL
jgi:hypothetical protein